MKNRTLLALLGSFLVLGSLWLAFGTGRRPTPREAGTRRASRLLILDPPDGRTELLGDGSSTKLRSIVVDVPSVLSWRTAVPEGARLETNLSFSRAELAHLHGLTCRAQVVAREGDSSPQVLLARELQPASGWEPFLVDLQALGGRTVELQLSLGCGENPARVRAGAGRWSVPLLSTPPGPDDLNVLLITVDTLRPDHLGAYGRGRSTSPEIDALARRGLLFTHAETVQSATWPALTSLHTSRYPSDHGVVWNGHRMPEGLATLAEVLAAQGYSTSAYITNMTRGRHPGFGRLFLARDGGQAEADRAAIDEAREQLAREKDRRFFMWVHLLSPHADYDPPAPFAERFARSGATGPKGEIELLSRLRRQGTALGASQVAHVVDLYDGEVAFVDEQVGRLLEALRALGLERNTLVILTADHGEDLYEHNRYFFHSPSIYGSSMRIPLVFALPGRLPAGARTDHLASLVDLAPTVLDLLGLPPVPEFAGVNLLPGGRIPSRPVRELAFGETGGLIHSVRSAEWRLIHNPDRHQPDAPGGPYPIGEVELYDLRADVMEARNLAAERPEVVRALIAAVSGHRSRMGRALARPSEITPEALEELRALGYLAQ